MTVTLTRRERQRAATVEEIKEVARRLMREQGTVDVARVPGNRDGPHGGAGRGHCFSRFVIVAITAPTRRLMPPLDTSAISRFAGFGGR